MFAFKPPENGTSINSARNSVSRSLYNTWMVNVYSNIYVLPLSTPVESAIAAVQEQSSTLRRHKEILANTISILYIFH